MKLSTNAILCIVSVMTLVMLQALSCYKKDPGYGGPDYPPEPPVFETVTDASRHD